MFRVNGFQGPGQFPRTLEMARQVADRVIGWEVALEREPRRRRRALLRLGVHLFEQESYDERRPCCAAPSSTTRARASANAARAACCSRSSRSLTRDFDEAERLVKEALLLGPDADERPRLLFVLGRTYVSSGRQEEGVATFEVIVQQFPQSPMAQKAKETLTSLRRRP